MGFETPAAAGAPHTGVGVVAGAPAAPGRRGDKRRATNAPANPRPHKHSASDRDTPVRLTRQELKRRVQALEGELAQMRAKEAQMRAKEAQEDDMTNLMLKVTDERSNDQRQKIARLEEQLAATTAQHAITTAQLAAAVQQHAEGSAQQERDRAHLMETLRKSRQQNTEQRARHQAEETRLRAELKQSQEDLAQCHHEAAMDRRDMDRAHQQTLQALTRHVRRGVETAQKEASHAAKVLAQLTRAIRASPQNAAGAFPSSSYSSSDSESEQSSVSATDDEEDDEEDDDEGEQVGAADDEEGVVCASASARAVAFAQKAIGSPDSAFRAVCNNLPDLSADVK